MNIRHPERYEKWSSILEDWKFSGLSIAEYCRRNEIRRGLFFEWKKRINDFRREETSPAGFVAVEFASEPGGCGIGVLVGDGIELRLSKGFDESELLRAIRVLRNSGC